MGWDAFISYSSEDERAAETTYAALEAAGLRCWIASRNIPPGGVYPTAIVDGIENSRVLVLIFSSNANTSPDVLREVQLARSRNIRIVPLRIENVVPTAGMAYFLNTVQRVDAITPPLEGHLQDLAASIKAQLALESPPEGGQPRSELRVRQAPDVSARSAQKRVKSWSQGIGVPVAIVIVLLLVIASLYYAQYFSSPPDTWPVAQLNGTNLEVFSCEAGNKAGNDAVAIKIKDRLEQNQKRGWVRISTLTANRQAELNVKGYQIRYETVNNEKDLATLIKPVVDKLISPDAFVPYPVQNKTPSYLSLFVCPT